jgi:hypothetical protein
MRYRDMAWVWSTLDITETNMIQLVLSGMQNRTFSPCLAAMNRILISLMERFSLDSV